MLYSQNQKRTKTTQQKLLLNVSKKSILPPPSDYSDEGL